MDDQRPAATDSPDDEPFDERVPPRPQVETLIDRLEAHTGRTVTDRDEFAARFGELARNYFFVLDEAKRLSVARRRAAGRNLIKAIDSFEAALDNAHESERGLTWSIRLRIPMKAATDSDAKAATAAFDPKPTSARTPAGHCHSNLSASIGSGSRRPGPAAGDAFAAAAEDLLFRHGHSRFRIDLDHDELHRLAVRMGRTHHPDAMDIGISTMSSGSVPPILWYYFSVIVQTPSQSSPGGVSRK